MENEETTDAPTPMEMSKIIGARLLALRKTRRLSREKTMEISGVHWDMLRRIEEGTRSVSVSQLLELCGAYEADASAVIATNYAIAV